MALNYCLVDIKTIRSYIETQLNHKPWICLDKNSEDFPVFKRGILDQFWIIQQQINNNYTHSKLLPLKWNHPMDLLPIIAAFGTKEKKICITMDPN